MAVLPDPFLAAALLGAPEADLPPSPLALTWEAPPSCPASAFEGEVSTLLEGRAPPAEQIRVRAFVQEATGAWTLELDITWQGDHAHRAFTGASCDAVIDAAAFVVVTTMDPAAGQQERAEPHPSAEDDVGVIVPPPPVVATPPASRGGDGPDRPAESQRPQPRATPSPEPDPTPTASTSSEPARPSAPVHGMVDFAGAVSGLSLPGVGGSVRLGIGPVGPHWEVRAYGTFRFPTEVLSEEDPDAGARVSRWSAGAEGCGVVGRAQWTVPLCGGIELGQVLATGFGDRVENPETARELWVAPVLAAAGRWRPIPRFGLRLGAIARIPLRRPTFVLRGLDAPLFTVGPFELGAQLAAEVHFP